MKTISAPKWSTLLLILLFTVIGNFTFSQTSNTDLTVTLTPEEGLVPCGVQNANESVHVVATDDLTDIEFTFDLPPGILYVVGTIEGASELDISDLNSPVFELGNLNSFEAMDFSFTRTVICDAVQFANEGNSLKDAYSVTYNGGAESPLVDDDPLLSTYIINSSTLVISAITTEYVNVGAEVEDREITVNQGGTGCIESFTHFVVIEPNTVTSYGLFYNGTLLIPNAESNIDTLFYDIILSVAPFNTVGNSNDCFDNGENITFQESFVVTGCDQIPSKHHSFWGCYPGDHCQDATPQTGAILFSTEVPDISINYADSSVYGLDLCNTTTFEMVVSNDNLNDGGAALDILINLGLGHNSSQLTQHDYNPFWHYANMPGDDGSWDTRFISNFTVNGIATTDTTNWGSTPYGEEDRSVIMIKDLFTVDPDGAGVGLEDLDNDGFYDDLGPGESFTFSYDIHFENIPEDCNDNGYAQFLGWEHCYTDVSFLDQCHSQRPGKRRDVSYQNMISQYNVTNVLTAPTDIYNGQEFEISIIPKLSVYPVCGNNEKTIKIAVELPDGITWTGEQPDFNVDNNISNVLDTMYMNGVELVYEINKINSYTEVFNFPLTIDCGIYFENTVSLPVVGNYTCGDGCFSRDYFCGIFPTITTHCPGPCAGPLPFGMDAHRITAGWQDESMTNFVDLDTLPEHELDSYLARDTMQVDTYTVISDTTLSNLWIDIYYNSTLVDNEVLEYISSSYSALDLSTGITTTGIINIEPELTTDNTGNWVYRFDLSQTIPTSQIFEDGDSIWFNSIYSINEDYEAGTQLNFPEFRFRPFSVLQGGEERSCNSWGDQVRILRSNVFLGSWFGNSTQLNLCTPTNMSAGTMRVWDNVSDQHPSEYRPPVIFESYTVYLPENVIFTGSVSYQDFVGDIEDPNGDLLIEFDELNNVVTFYPNPNGLFFDHDQGALQARQLRMGVIASCDLSDEGLIPFIVDAEFHKFTYTDQPEELNYEDFTMSVYTFDYTAPSFVLQSPNIVNDGTSDIAVWDVEVANTSTGGIPFNWLRIEELDGIEIIDIQETATMTSVNYVSDNGYTFAEIGNIEPGGVNTKTVRISALFTDCNPQIFEVFHGWDCLNFPTDYSSEDESLCYINSVDLAIEPLTSEVQFQVINNLDLPVTMCQPFEVEMEITSTNAADLVNPYISFIIPGGSAGLTVVDDVVNVEYPYNSGDVQEVSVTYDESMVIINLMEHSVIDEIHGIYGVANDNTVDGRKAKITMIAQTHCEYIANSIMFFRAYGESPCGDNAVGNGITSSTEQISILDAVVDYEFINTISVPTDGSIGCEDVDTISFESFLFSGVNGETGNEDQGKIVLPVGVSYNGDFNCTTVDNCPVFVSTSYNGQGEQEVLFDIPEGMENGDLLEYSITVMSDFEGCSQADIRLSTFTNVYGVVCESENCPVVVVQTGYVSGNYSVSKPLPKIENSENSSVVVINAITNNYFIEFDLINDFELPLSEGYVYNIYCADSIGESVGISLYTGLTDANILSDSTLTVISTFQSIDLCNPENGIVITFVPSETNCQCEPVIANLSLIELEDTDYDGVIDAEDEDIDNDGITNIQEDLNLDGDNDFTTNETDSDNDGIPNYKDLDSDNDGIADIIEAGALDSDGDGRVPVNEDETLTFDFENDGLTDEFIVDTDFDGEADQAVDLLIAGAAQIPYSDTDLDGIPNVIDIDSDGDGIPDVIENGKVDSDNDGHLDYATLGSPMTMLDSDGDGFADEVDTNDNSLQGTNDGAEYSPVVNSDNDIYPNFLDIDSDGDGIVDIIEGMPTFDYLIATNSDTDSDGLDDAYDGDDQTTIELNDGTGTVIVPTDTDQDGIPDYLDLDSDNDEFPDLEEGWDMDNDGISDSTPFEVDIDQDGLDNAFDTEQKNDSLVTPFDNVSNNMTPLEFPDFDNHQGDRDWREEFLDLSEFNVLDGFSPNGDGANDFLIIEGIENFPDHEITIFNRWGNIVWKTTDYVENPWDGTSMYGITMSGNVLPAGTYFYFINLNDENSAIDDEEELQGFIYLNK